MVLRSQKSINFKYKESSIRRHTAKRKEIVCPASLYISLIRLEDDPNLQSFLIKNKIKSGFKKFRCSPIKKNVSKNSSNKLVCDGDLKENKNENNLLDLSGINKLKLREVETINKMAFDSCGSSNIGTHSENEELGNSKYSDIFTASTKKEIVSIPKRNKLIKKNGDCASDLSPKGKITDSEINLHNFTSPKPNTVEEKISKVYKCQSKIANNASPLLEGMTPSRTRSCTSGEKRTRTTMKSKISPDIEEPLNLISKLTGCQIPPSKVKILPLTTSCKSSDQESNNSAVLNLISSHENNVEKERPYIHCVNSNADDIDKLFEEKDKTQNVINSSATVEKLDVPEEEVRTVYDVMDYISVVMPSWNLHILSDTNTFCICQVTRSESGIPYLSKSIELDDNFNGKVYIYKQHCKKFDGVYNSEDAVMALIKEVDKIE